MDKECFVGIDVSLKTSALCVVDRAGGVIAEVKAASEPEALFAAITQVGRPIAAIGLEAGPLSQFLWKGLTDAGLPVVLMETRRVKGALQAMPVKTDRRDALGIAQLLRMGWFRPVHCKSASAQELRAVLAARRTLMSKMLDIELSVRGILRGFGLKVGAVSRGRFPGRIRELAAGNPMLETMAEALLRARDALRGEFIALDRKLREIARTDEICRLLMTAPGVGAVVAATVKAGIDDPARFRSSKMVGPHFGLTPGRSQSGERDVTGRITCAGDAEVRTALHAAANALMIRSRKETTLKSWGRRVARRRGMRRAIVAVARKLGVILHRMWSNGRPFRLAEDAPKAMAA